MTTEQKIYAGGGFAIVLITIIGVVFAMKQDEKLHTPLLGQAVNVSGGHMPDTTQITYSTNPPAGGKHYETTAHAGFYDKAPADGYLVHSLEHGAVILWYNPNLPRVAIEKLKTVFYQTSGKGIMAPRSGMDVPFALSSWGQLLKLKSFDEEKIKSFFVTNGSRGPEQAPI